MSSTKIIVWTVVAAFVVAALLILFVGNNPASSVGPKLEDRNRVDHYVHFSANPTAMERQVVNGTEGNDVIHGNKVGPGKPAQVINGLGGDDRIWGGKGADYINGDAGNDRLHGYHAAADTIDGGPGRDVCVIGETPGGHTNDTLVSCEKVKVRSAQGHG